MQEVNILNWTQLGLGASQVVLVIKNLPANAGDVRDTGSIPELGRSPEGGHGNPLQYSHLENPHGQKSLAGYSPWGHKESETTEQLSTTHTGTLLFCFLQIPALGSLDGLIPPSRTRGMQCDYLMNVCPPLPIL